ncbi:MAG: hypothetical protein Q8P01_06140 [bacterium]|nr:hypothetical protein [bacterium]
MGQQKRISFGEFDAAHLYSLAVENFCISEREGICFACVSLRARLEKMIGEKEARAIQRQVKKHPN